MMVLEIELQHAESIHKLVLSQIPEFMPQSRANCDWTSAASSFCTISWHFGIEIQIPSTSTPDRNSWVVICRGKNRFVEGLHARDPGHNPTSNDLLVERSIAKESEPCSTELEQSRIEETHATQSKIPTNPVYHSKEVIPVGEGSGMTFLLATLSKESLFQPKSQYWS